MPATSSEGRRAAQASAAPMDNDQVERDANLKKVQARDLVEFGMIPVRILFMHSRMRIYVCTRFFGLIYVIFFRSL